MKERRQILTNNCLTIKLMQCCNRLEFIDEVNACFTFKQIFSSTLNRNISIRLALFTYKFSTSDEGIKIKCVFSSQFHNSYFIGKFVDLKISGIHFAHCMHNLFLQIDKSIKSIIQFQ